MPPVWLPLLITTEAVIAEKPKKEPAFAPHLQPIILEDRGGEVPPHETGVTKMSGTRALPMAGLVPSTVDNQTLDPEKFKDLPLSPARLTSFSTAPPKERLRLLFLSEHPKALVQSLPELDLFLTVKTLEDSKMPSIWSR